jgi:hypothetical protein
VVENEWMQKIVFQIYAAYFSVNTLVSSNLIRECMFWKKEKQIQPIKPENLSRPYRFCIVYISDKYKHIIFVPQGKIIIGAYAELENIIEDVWPCDFGQLQKNIEEALNRFLESTQYIKGNWPSYKNSKAKSQKSFESDYIAVWLETDLSKPYGEKEVERIRVTAHPTLLDNTYCLTGTGHLLDTKIAQILCDIFDACLKIRS